MNDFLQNLRGNQKDNRAAKTRRGFDNSQHQHQHYNNPPAHFHSNSPYQNSRVGNVKRPMRNNPQNQVCDTQPVMISSEVVENITALAETMLKNQEFLGAAQERLAAAEERKVEFLAEIAEYLRVIAVPASRDEDRFVEDRYAGEERIEGAFDEPEYECVEEAEVEVPKVVETPVKKRRGRKPKAVKLAEEKAAAEKKARTDKVKVLKRTKAQKLKAAQESDTRKELLSRDEVLEIVNSMREKGATFDQVAQHLVELGQPTFSGRGEWHAQTVHRLCNSAKKK